MQPLIIEYVLDSRRPGYTFTAGTDGHSQAVLDDVWRGAMPRGQGWRAYTGARSLKCFPVAGGRRMAISTVTVTDAADESGRRGIRRAEVVLIDRRDYLDALQARLDAMPDPVRGTADRLLTLWRWKRILNRATPKMRERAGQIVLSAPYATPEAWRAIEAAVLRVVTSRRLRAVKGWAALPTLTTLALTPHDGGRVVALPQAAAQTLPARQVIALGR